MGFMYQEVTEEQKDAFASKAVLITGGCFPPPTRRRVSVHVSQKFAENRTTECRSDCAANSGCGYEACRQLALAGWGRIILGCRNEGRADEAVKNLQEITGKKVFEATALSQRPWRMHRRRCLTFWPSSWLNLVAAAGVHHGHAEQGIEQGRGQGHQGARRLRHPQRREDAQRQRGDEAHGRGLRDYVRDACPWSCSLQLCAFYEKDQEDLSMCWWLDTPLARHEATCRPPPLSPPAT